MSGIPSLFVELKRRNVLRAGVLYIGAVWALAQGLAQLLPLFGNYAWIARWFVVACAIGFPFWIAFAWFYEFTPQGLKRESEIAPDDSVAHSTGRKLDKWIIAVLVVAVVLLVSNQFVWRRGAGLQAQSGGAAAAFAIPAKSIAVLPFENLSTDKGNAYFADGMQDLILTKLADIGDLKVISRTSTEKYASHPDDLKTIGQQLGVATILEGSVQKSGNQVLINVQLIDARTDSHIWAESYTRTLDNIFGVEGEVAQKVADALKAKLTATEQQNVAAVPTTNPQAYDAFLKAESLANKAQDAQQQEGLLAADAEYKRAIAFDPGFALAYARLAFNQMYRDWFAVPLSASELAGVKTLAERALTLAPDLPEAHVALGCYYYWGFRRYRDASAEFQRALQLAPNNINALQSLAYIARRQGRWTQALTFFRQAILIAPRNAEMLSEYGRTLGILRQYAKAQVPVLRALAIDPGNDSGKDALWFIRLIGYGDAEGARKAYDPPPGWRLSYRNSGSVGGVIDLINPRVYPEVFERHFGAALHDWDSAPTATEEARLTQRAARVAIQIIAGRKTTIRPECEKLEPLLAAELARHPDSLYLLQQAGWVDVCLGRAADAIAAAQHAVDVLPVSKDAFAGVFQLESLAEIETYAGAKDDALKLIEKLLSIPAGEVMSVARLKLDPVWDPLRKDPRFQALLNRYARFQPVQATDQPASGSSTARKGKR